MKNLSEKEKTQYMRIALGLSNISVDDHTAEYLWRVFEEVGRLKGKFSIHDGVKIRMFMDERVKQHSISERKRLEAVIAKFVSQTPKKYKAETKAQLEKLLLKN